MKKRGIVIVSTFFIGLVIILLTNNTYAYGNGVGPCPQGGLLTEGHDDYHLFKDDPYFDAVEICGLCYACDWDVSDGVCPEDYSNGTKRASCTDHPDIDCHSRLSGVVRSLVDGRAIYNAKVTAVPPPGSSYDPFVSYTDEYGNYFIEYIPSGRWVFRAEKSGYDTEIVEEIIEYGGTNILDFYLPEGSCNSDCTNSFGRCSADCDGINGCQYSSPLIMELCDDQIPGTEVIISESGEIVTKAVCCNGNVELREYRPKSVVHGDMEELVLRETVAKLGTDIVIVKIAVWS